MKTNNNKKEIKKAVKKVVKEYGETLRLLGKETIKKAAHEGFICLEIQKIVWDYMDTSIEKRDGTEMAMKIMELFK